MRWQSKTKGYYISRRCVLAVLDALVQLGQSDGVIIADVAGYTINGTGIALNWLVDHGQIARPYQGTFIATESGKIAIAIHRGFQRRVVVGRQAQKSCR